MDYIALLVTEYNVPLLVEGAGAAAQAVNKQAVNAHNNTNINAFLIFFIKNLLSSLITISLASPF